MKKVFYSALCLILISVTIGCQNAKTKAGEGALIGGLLGATAGGIIGHQSRHGGEGAGIGAAAGAIAGAIVGSQIDKPGQEAAQPQQAAPAAQALNPNQMSLQQIVDLSKQGAHEAVIIDKIRMSNSKYNLTAEDVTYLKQQGVSQGVISVMQGA